MIDTPSAKFFIDGGAALLLGLSVGLERERSAHEERHVPFAGIRTFPLASLAGFLCALLQGDAVLVAGLLSVAALAVAAHMRSGREGHPGVTTEAAFVLTYLLGAGCARGMVLECASIALLMTTLLAGREQLRQFAQRLPERDLAAALKFGVISIVVLPLIPDRLVGNGWWAVNFHKTWLMVVLISGIGFAGYILTRLVGPRAGTGLAGLVGGLVSSTAVALTFSRKSRETPELSASCALAILAACAVLWIRVMAEALFVNPRFAGTLAPAGVGILGVSALMAAFAYRRADAAPHTGNTGVVHYRNPVELRPAITFALAYAVVTIVFRLAKDWGSQWTYVSAFLSGLNDMDAITLAMADMTKSGSIPYQQGAAAVVLAGCANTLVKLGIALVLASTEARRIVAVGLGITCAATVGALFLVLAA
ncbi:MAG: MgtC/SapB family protein [Planctomycetota bacterium]